MALKDFTKDLHEQAERNPFAQRLLSGEITAIEYATYLANLEIIYRSIENIAELHGLLEGIEDIKRTDKIRADLEEFNFNRSALTILPSTLKYVQYLEELSELSPKDIMAHLYTRHFGDLYGGQILKTKVPGSGTMYDFQDRKELIGKTRALLSDDLATEAMNAFIFAIGLFEDLVDEFDIQ